MSEQQGGMSFSQTIEGDGYSGVALTWSIVITLVVGLAGGAWGAWAMFRFQPSEEYLAGVAAMEVRLDATGDSLRIAQLAIAEADRVAAEAEAAAETALDNLEESRRVAALARQRADAAAARAVGARSDPDASPEEIAAAEDYARQTATEATVMDSIACAACGRTVARQRFALDALDQTIRLRNGHIGVLQTEYDALWDAYRAAQAEVDRAAGRIVHRWWHPVVTVGPSLTATEHGLAPGLALTVGFSTNPLRWFRR